jgi:hypothetical protein
MPGGGNQALEHAECGLSTSGLVRAHDALGNVSSASEVGLRQVGAGTGFSKQRTRRVGCGLLHEA